MNDNWWEPYVPKLDEAWDDYVRRATGFDLEFVMMKHEPNDLDLIGRAHQLMATPHAFVPGKYVVAVIRDLVFLVYSEVFENDEW